MKSMILGFALVVGSVALARTDVIVVQPQPVPAANTVVVANGARLYEWSNTCAGAGSGAGWAINASRVQVLKVLRCGEFTYYGINFHGAYYLVGSDSIVRY